MEKIEIKTGAAGHFQIVKVNGRIDAETTKTLIDQLSGLIQAGKKNIVLDLEGVTFMSSAGIGAMVKTLSDTKQIKGTLRLASVRPDVRKVFEILGFASAFSFFNSLKEAIEK